MKASLTLNHKAQLALFYDEPLGITPEWASIDVTQGEIYIGGQDVENKTVKLDKIDERIYARVKNEPQILLIRVQKDGAHEPDEALFVPLMISQQL